MEYYTTEKNNNSLNFAGKWMKLENIILKKSRRRKREKLNIRNS